jgi:hypothetical protein
MDHSAFTQDFPLPNPDVRRLAEQYEAECEAYDRTVCTGPIRDGSIMPATPQEFAQVQRHAREVLRRVLTEATSLGISRAELWREIGRLS